MCMFARMQGPGALACLANNTMHDNDLTKEFLQEMLSIYLCIYMYIPVILIYVCVFIFMKKCCYIIKYIFDTILYSIKKKM